MKDLECRYDSRKSFYGKAQVEETEGVGDEIVITSSKKLYSYGILVAEIRGNNAIIYGQYFQTTTRHQKEFLKQNGFYADNIKQMLRDYAS